MSPSHHPPEEWVLAYVAGSGTEALDLLVAAHATLCPSCRAHIADLEEAAAHSLAEDAGVPVGSGALDALLAQLDVQDAPREPLAPHPDGLPMPVRRYLADDALPWRFLIPGIQQVELPIVHGDMPVRLLHLAPGLKVPEHTHAGLERTLVLSGGYDDQAGTFERGDLGVRDASTVHVQRIHADAPCVALVVADAPLVPEGLLSTMLSWFVRA
ncbi:MAG: ChrR family anti-sigma-E factor [Myxococcales bacterium]|nr:ChrR family anti-sigma-E factor [Myxococcales bacterium]MCB9694427.1 cupin domain-containing protein [Alphaproteobacteria bacterium]